MSNNHESVHIYVRFPRWLEYSGLPAILNKRYGQHAWAIFKKLIEFDWMWNQDKPDYFDVTHEEIAESIGVSRCTVSRCVNSLAEGGVIEYHPGQYTRNKSRFRIKEPLTVRKSIGEISYKQGGNKGKRGRPGKARYAHESVSDSNALSGSNDKTWQHESVADSKKSVASSSESIASGYNKEIRKRFKGEVKDEKFTTDCNTASSVLKDWNAVIDSKKISSGQGEALCPVK